MSALNTDERRIVGFLCNWCSYGGADTAGVARFTQPTDLRIIRVPCSGRVNPLFPLKALLNGADGVLVSGCHPRDCHYSAGNYYARRRLELLKEFLPIIGIDPARFEYTWVSASEGQKWQEVVTNFTNRIHKLGPAPLFADIEPRLDMPTSMNGLSRPLGCGKHPALDELKDAIKKALPDLECVIGWKEGFDALHATPHFMKTPEDVDALIWGPTNVHSLATYLYKFAGKKVGIVVKGCDSKGIVELLQEELIKREDVVIFGMGCNGTINVSAIAAKLGDAAVESLTGSGTTIKIVAGGKEHSFDMKDVSQAKCRLCMQPSATEYDFFAGKPTLPPDALTEAPAILEFLDAFSLPERMAFWKGHMDRCMRCYACRNACPMCVCQDHCVADSRDPHWLSQEDSTTDKFFFQLIHALHLAGRCTGCGECNRACPMGIPVGALKMQTGRIIAKLFDGYKPGADIDAIPPLLGYEPVEKNIHEHHIEGA